MAARVALLSLPLLFASAAPPPPPPPPGYVSIDALSDEFEGDALDASKWLAHSPGWPGRAPGLFEPANVVVGGGALQLWARAARRNASWPTGYDNYTTAAVHSVARTRLGYLEIRWRSGSSGISSSFWLHDNNGTAWTEIDVFETTGVTNAAPGGANASVMPSHVHVFALPGEPVSGLPARCGCREGTPGEAPCSIGAAFALPDGATFAGAWHTAALNWTEGMTVYLVDGVPVSQIASPCLLNELGVDFDRETMPGWMVLPPPGELPDAPFLVDYIRAYAVAPGASGVAAAAAATEAAAAAATEAAEPAEAAAAAAARPPNILVVILDDMDNIDSFSVMPTLVNEVFAKGTNVSEARVASPICCPSRTSLFSGRYPHNLGDDELGWCGNFSVEMEDTWLHSVKDAGYVVGQFGKYWNGGEGSSGLFCSRNYTPAWFDPAPASGDDLLLLCEEGVYFGNLYNDRGSDVTRGNAPSDYMTSVLGNRTLAFLRNATARADGKPWAAYLAPHAPHLPATPAPWHADAPVPQHAPRPSNWNLGWEDKHFMVDNHVDKPMSGALVNGSDNLHAARLRTLMSVDDALRDSLALLDAAGAADNTVVVVTSDHGYRLGQWGLWCEKASPYETDARVPLVFRGPGVARGAVVDALVTMNVDLGPTLLELAGVPDRWPAGSGRRDGVSLLPLLASAGGAAPPGWRDRVLVEFVGWASDEWLSPCQFALDTGPNIVNCSGAKDPPAGLINSESNRYTSLRVKNATHDAMYGEWRPPKKPAQPSETNFTELYDLRADPGQVNNLAVKGRTDPGVLASWSSELWGLAACEGAECP